MGDSTLVQDVHKGHRPRQAGAKVKDGVFLGVGSGGWGEVSAAMEL